MTDPTSLFFEALSNKSRFNILKELKKGEKCAGDLQKKLNIEQTNLSHNLKCLLNCKFIEVKKIGRKRVYKINPETEELVIEISKHIKKYEDYLKKCGVLKEEDGRI